MKNTFVLLFLIAIGLSSFAQSLKTVTVIPQRSYYLNGGTRASLGGLSRETIKIDLPEHTVACLYSFTTTPGVDGTELLNLGLQVGATLYGGSVGASIASQIKIPKGSGALDIFVLPINSRDSFLSKGTDWKCYKDISLQNAKQAVQYIDTRKYPNSFYLGLRNPSAIAGIAVSVEVVAIVEEAPVANDKGILYGNLGWSAYEKGDYNKCLELSNKALTCDPSLSYVKFNIALVHLAQAQDDAIDYYVEAITSCKNDKNPRFTLSGALVDIRNLKTTNYFLKNITEIEDLIANEINRY